MRVHFFCLSPGPGYEHTWKFLWIWKVGNNCHWLTFPLCPVWMWWPGLLRLLGCGGCALFCFLFLATFLFTPTGALVSLSILPVSPLREQAVFLTPFLVFPESPTMLNTPLLLCFRLPQPLHPPCSAFVPSDSESHSPVTCSLERLMSVEALSSRSWMRVFPKTDFAQTPWAPPLRLGPSYCHTRVWFVTTHSPPMVTHLFRGTSRGEDTWQRPEVWRDGTQLRRHWSFKALSLTP